MKYIITVIFLVSSFSASANPVPEFPFIILTESLERRVEPDLVKISFGLLAYSPTSSESLEKLRSAGRDVIALLKKHEIPLSLLESTQIDKYAKRARTDRVYDLDVLGYETQQSFTLELSELEKYPSLVNELIAIDGLSKISAFFKTTNEAKYKAEMIQELSQKARETADVLAQAQSRTVKGVYGITTEGNFGKAYAIFKLQYEQRLQYDQRWLPVTAGFSLDGMDLTMMVPEYIEVSQRMTTIYELK